MHLLINPNGSKYWRLQYRFEGGNRKFQHWVFIHWSLLVKPQEARWSQKVGIWWYRPFWKEKVLGKRSELCRTGLATSRRSIFVVLNSAIKSLAAFPTIIMFPPITTGAFYVENWPKRIENGTSKTLSPANFLHPFQCLSPTDRVADRRVSLSTFILFCAV